MGRCLFQDLPVVHRILLSQVPCRSRRVRTCRIPGPSRNRSRSVYGHQGEMQWIPITDPDCTRRVYRRCHHVPRTATDVRHDGAGQRVQNTKDGEGKTYSLRTTDVTHLPHGQSSFVSATVQDLRMPWCYQLGRAKRVNYEACTKPNSIAS